MTRNGKIARLPRTVREELNRRMQEVDPGLRLVARLNGLPDTQRVLANGFGGRPVSKQYLAEWKAGGYREELFPKTKGGISKETLRKIEKDLYLL